jgi:hypothetical protein
VSPRPAPRAAAAGLAPEGAVEGVAEVAVLGAHVVVDLLPADEEVGFVADGDLEAVVTDTMSPPL